MYDWINGLISLIEREDSDEVIVHKNSQTIIIKNKKTTVTSLIHEKLNREDLTSIIQDFAWENGERLDPQKPHAGGRFRNFRWHAIIPPLCDHPVFCLRKHRFVEVDLDSFQIDKKIKTDIFSLLEGGSSLLICGSTGCGKTTLLLSIMKTLFQEKRLVILEDLRELPIDHHLWINLKSRTKDLDGNVEINLSQLLYEALRLHPERIIIGEIRQRELFAFVEATATAHSGVLTTFHANSILDIKKRLSALTQHLSTDAQQELFYQEEQSLWCLFLESKGFRVRSLERLTPSKARL